MVTKIITLSVLFFACFVIVVYPFKIELSNEKDACSKNCQNGAKCTKMGKYEFCKCLPGTFGDDCGIVPDCIDEVIKCNEKSNSVCGYNVQLKLAECICDKFDLAYDRNTETCRVTCNGPEICKNGAACKSVGNYDFCDCIPGTFGDFCEYVTSCVEETMVCKKESGADCRFNILEKRPECLCFNGLKYDPYKESCSEPCEGQNTCKNGGTCTMSGHYSFCECTEGTTGPTCEEVTKCKDGSLICKNNSNCDFNLKDKRAECICKDGLKYDTVKDTCRETCDEMNVCKNGGTCTESGHYSFCECIQGTTGPICEEVTNCKDGSLTCKTESEAICGFNIKNKRTECLCNAGLKYDTLNQTCRETCDENNVCENGGACTKLGHYSFCECIQGTTGPTCGDVTGCINGSITCKTESNSKCGFNDKDKRAECLCKPGLKYDTANETCRETCDERNVCENGGACTELGHYSFCECIQGTTGPRCKEVTNCKDGSLTCKLESEAECGFNVKNKRAECLCKPGLKYDTGNETCKEACDEENLCENGGICTKSGHYSFCECIPGTTGHLCEEITDCSDAIIMCEIGSECGFNVKDKKAECLCEPGLKYDILSETCRETCNAGYDCENGASCFEIGSYYFCKCPNGTYGEKCEIVTDCESNKLTCKEGSGAKCGYNIHMDVAECICDYNLKYDPSIGACKETCDGRCENGGVCKEFGKYAFCECRPGTYGDKCEGIIGCDYDLVTCKESSGAACGYNLDLNVTECICPHYLKYDAGTEACRETCEDYDTCQNGAVCTGTGHYNFCQCLNGTFGHHCENVTECHSGNITCNRDSGAVCGYNPILQVAECLCDDGLMYDKDSETCRENCSPLFDDCMNGALCSINTTFGYGFCVCIPGTFGNKCEHVSDCVNKVLECNITSGLVCGFNVTAGNAACLCEDDSLVYDRESDTCLDLSSSTDVSTSTTHHTASPFPTNAITDVEKTRQPFLTSTATYVNKCNSNPAICPKLSTECVAIGNDYYCKCKTGFRLKTGDVQEYNKKPCIKKKCDCGIKSYNCHWSVEGRKICSCFLGYSQIKGVCTDCNCGMNSVACVFDDKGRKLCGCKTGYFQRNSTCSEMCNNDQDCQNRGVCEFESNGYFCKCKSPFKGDRCEINEACEHLSNTCHAIGAICQYIESLRKPVCVCSPNRYFDDKSNMCKEKYESDSSLLIVLCLISGFLLISTITLIIVFNKFRSRGSKK